MKKIIVGILTVLIPAALVLLSQQNYTISEPVNQQWQQWKSEHGAIFEGDIDLYRRFIFLKNCDFIERHNSHESRSYDMSVNQFSHFSTQEFDEMFSSKKHREIVETTVGQ